MEHIRVVPVGWMPLTMGGCTSYVFDEGQIFFTVFLNDKLSFERQQLTYFHEVEHIDNKDFSKMVHVSLLEAYMHAIDGADTGVCYE